MRADDRQARHGDERREVVARTPAFVRPSPAGGDLFVRPGILSSAAPPVRHHSATHKNMSTPPTSHFLLVFRNSEDEPDPTPAEMEQIFGKWMAWMKGMKARGEFVGANRLQDAGKVLRGARGASVSDGPFVEAKEMIGGYILVAAANLARATEIARDCPGLEHGTIVEVRPVEELPPI
jgi:hypothetical protein